MRDEIKEVFEDWKIPESLHERAYEIVKLGGLTLVSENFEYHTDITPEYLDQLEKKIRGYVLFEAKNWYEMIDILKEVFQYDQLESFGLFDEDELFNRLEKNDLLHFREEVEEKPEKTIVCTKGYKLKEKQKEEILKGYEKWRKDLQFWEDLRSNK